MPCLPACWQGRGASLPVSLILGNSVPTLIFHSIPHHTFDVFSSLHSLLETLTRSVIASSVKIGLWKQQGTGRGVSVGGILGDDLLVVPPFIVTEADCDEIAEAARAGIMKVQSDLGY
jgi:hypothetical protein